MKNSRLLVIGGEGGGCWQMDNVSGAAAHHNHLVENASETLWTFRIHYYNNAAEGHF